MTVDCTEVGTQTRSNSKRLAVMKNKKVEKETARRKKQKKHEVETQA